MKTIQGHCLALSSLVVSILLSWVSPLHGQDTASTTPDHHFWLNYGGGVSPPDWLAVGASFTYEIDEGSIASIRYAHSEEFNIISISETVWDVGVLYGFKTKGDDVLASLSGGIGIVGGVHKGEHISFWEDEEVTFRTAGIALEGQLFWRPLSFLGIGIYVAANLNKERSYAAALVALQLGTLK
jgi:hypothetical protein